MFFNENVIARKKLKKNNKLLLKCRRSCHDFLINNISRVKKI